MATKTKLFVALDQANAKDAFELYKKVRPANPYFKVGLELFCAEGPDFVRKLIDDGAKIFLDLKFHDIPNTVAQAAVRAAKLNVGWLNLHLSGGEEMVRATVEKLADAGSKSCLLGVTVLTSMDTDGLHQIGVLADAASHVEYLARKGKEWGIGGVVCSAQELAAVHKACGKDFVTVVPGIRPKDAAANDQKRTMTPEEAAQAGAHFIVVGRPISAAKDPLGAAKKILESLS